jgi:hypothetical protein
MLGAAGFGLCKDIGIGFKPLGNARKGDCLIIFGAVRLWHPHGAADLDHVTGYRLGLGFLGALWRLWCL